MSASPKIKIAIASSGLGYIRRGIETWAEDLARALRQCDQDVTLFQGGGEVDATQNHTRVLSSPSRLDPKVKRRVQLLQKVGGWRYGFGSDYQAEQTLFVLRLWRHIHQDYDILHVQDPWIALVMERLHRAHLCRPRVILGHGTEESVEMLQKISYLQHLAPCYLDDWEAHRPRHQTVFAIPNFVDTTTFKPGNKQAARAEWDLPQDHLIVLSVAAIKSHHKRADYLIREFAAFSERFPQPALLVIAGAREAETDNIIALGKGLLGDRIRFFEGVSREKILSLYQTADIFALASLHEMLPIALLEALACGIPIICNNTPTLTWLIGKGGILPDLTKNDELARHLLLLSNPIERVPLVEKARNQAETVFSESVVAKQYIEMYNNIIHKND